MSNSTLHVLVVIGSLRQSSVSRIAVVELAAKLKAAGCSIDLVDLVKEPMPVYNPDLTYASAAYPQWKKRVEAADVVLIGAPDYHGGISGVLKNFFDHFWHEFSGKLFASVVASHEKGLTVIDQLRIIARQCYAWSMPYAISLKEDVDFKDGQIFSADLKERLQMFARDIHVYGRILATQRRADLAGTDPGFMAKHRKAAS